MKVLVTGATGFIGRRLACALCERGYTVQSLARRTGRGLPDAVTQLHGDLTDNHLLVAACAKCDLVYHLAAMISFDPARRNDLMRVNAGGTSNVLKAAKAASVSRVVVVSSACTLGVSDSPDEVRGETSSPLAKDVRRNPYLASKLAAEEASVLASRHQDVVIANPTTVYGPGDDSLNSGSLIMRVAGGRMLPVPGGGTNVVDVDDVVAGLLLLAERGRCGERYVMGAENMSFSDIMETISRVVGSSVWRVPLPRSAQEAMAVAAWIRNQFVSDRLLTPQIVRDMFRFKYYSSERAAQELGWQPRYAFGESVLRAWEYYKRVGLT